jgi:hypothetical protein
MNPASSAPGGPGQGGNGRSGCAAGAPRGCGPGGRVAGPAAGRILLPAWCALRRADGIEVIGAAAGLAMAGNGRRPIAAALGVPAATVRGWLRRLRARAGQLRQHAIGELGRLARKRAIGPADLCRDVKNR